MFFVCWLFLFVVVALCVCVFFFYWLLLLLLILASYVDMSQLGSICVAGAVELSSKLAKEKKTSWHVLGKHHCLELPIGSASKKEYLKNSKNNLYIPKINTNHCPPGFAF